MNTLVDTIILREPNRTYPRIPNRQELLAKTSIDSVSEIEQVDWPAPLPSVEEGIYPRLNGHDARWIQALSEGLSHRAYLLKVQDRGGVVGVLPLVLVRGPIFGRFLVSLPYLNTGGVWALDNQVATQLIGRACDLADELDVKYLELRHEHPVKDARLNFQRTDKCHMRLALPDSPDELLKSFKSKHRSQIKKADDYDLLIEFGGTELLNDFYNVFARNMRDLGTPVFSRKLFSCILREFHDTSEVCVVRKDGLPIASGLLVHAHGVTEVPSASSLREFNRTNANMLMYWHLLQRAIERGSRTFDFGRSSEGSGTYKFKAQWGAEPAPAVWQYYVRKGSPEEMRPDADGKERLVKLWQKLPVWLSRQIGPRIVRGIP
jgi:FemAB-related protein (PEP-CTERM system-associated)